MPPCLYICCHFEISDDQHGSPARPKSTSKTIQEGRRISHRHSTNRERPSARERQRESPRADRRHHSRRRSHSSSRNYHRYQQPNTTTTITTQETTTQEPQDQPPANQIIALRKRIEKEDTRHSLNLSNLQNQVTTEHARHFTHTKGFRSRLIDLSTAHRENLRISSPNKPQNQHHTNGNEVIVANGNNKQGYIAKWLEGLKSMSSFSGLRESTSDGMSSVEVVAAKDAKGKGKGIRIVSDGVEEGDGVEGGV
ncbi:uncharacterized protein M437DRAFT_43705 [Aureobasidium melanogenum CBS 110374]|uniref:Uncharacterized protein n=1 Tax=Aureobasidium melanogenum (strain CBS 110374) TaxID=1043003 RepID=A0A074VV98_AURM1|nr:uncharacterized protein M437DRAFT_43705 [Aureobasidium melanogenum CBS 110374]KEQ64690.1 hypothetical protein M437DRAFT_43705 [Aureobasidium melanogenum CBS 110374]